MGEAFEQAIERQACERFEDWLDARRNREGSCVKTVEPGAGTWYYHSIVSLFIEGERYEQEKNKSMKRSPLSTAGSLWMTAATMRA